MEAEAVAQLIDTEVAAVKLPPAGEITGVATVAAGVIVYALLAAALGS